ncbi:MAG: mechanosensitive ion channel family protein [ANME-2 cluster archaeon]|nr:mechanosensitive ion channel family protein [ANME-2 cluster archaeon]
MNLSEAIATYWPSWLSWNIATPTFIIVIIVVTFFIARLVNELLLGYFKKVSLKLKVDPTGYRLLRHLAVAAIYLLGLIIIVSSVPQLRSISVALFAGAGFAGIIIGLAAQSTLANIISGISLAMFQPFRVGDLVTIHEEYGTISDLTLRHTVVTTWDNRRLIIPNSIISDEAVINWSIEDPTVVWPVNIGISYDSDIDLARSIMLEEARNHPNVMEDHDVRMVHPEVLKGSEVKVLVTELGDFAVNLRLLVWVRTRGLAFGTGCELMESIKKRFDAEGVEIPFPYRTLVYKKDLPPNVSLEEGLVDVPDASSDEIHGQGS